MTCTPCLQGSGFHSTFPGDWFRVGQDGRAHHDGTEGVCFVENLILPARQALCWSLLYFWIHTSNFESACATKPPCGAFTSGGYQDHQQEKDGAHEYAWKDQTGNPDLAVLNPVEWICGKRKMFTWILGIALWFPGFWSILMWSDYMSCLTRPVIFSWLGAKKQRHWAETTGEKFRNNTFRFQFFWFWFCCLN